MGTCLCIKRKTESNKRKRRNESAGEQVLVVDIFLRRQRPKPHADDSLEFVFHLPNLAEDGCGGEVPQIGAGLGDHPLLLVGGVASQGGCSKDTSEMHVLFSPAPIGRTRSHKAGVPWGSLGLYQADRASPHPPYLKCRRAHERICRQFHGNRRGDSGQSFCALGLGCRRRLCQVRVVRVEPARKGVVLQGVPVACRTRAFGLPRRFMIKRQAPRKRLTRDHSTQTSPAAEHPVC